MIRLVALVCGLICGAGFVLSGLYDPDVLGAFVSPQSAGAVVMGFGLLAGITVIGCVCVLMRGSGKPLLGGQDEPLPAGSWAKQLTSAVLFGVGWGLAGYFPLAALVSAGTLSPGAVIFLVSVLAGMVLCDVVSGDRGFKSDRKGSRG